MLVYRELDELGVFADAWWVALSAGKHAALAPLVYGPGYQRHRRGCRACNPRGHPEPLAVSGAELGYLAGRWWKTGEFIDLCMPHADELVYHPQPKEMSWF